MDFSDPRFPRTRGPDYGFLFINSPENREKSVSSSHIEKNLLTVVKTEKIRQQSSTENQKGGGGKSALQIKLLVPGTKEL